MLYGRWTSQRAVPLVLVGNKCDLLSERQVSREAAVGLSRAWNSTPYYETSAKKEINVSTPSRSSSMPTAG